MLLNLRLVVYCVYHYTDRLGVKSLNLVPLLIPVAWFMMTYPSYVITERIMPARWGAWGCRGGRSRGDQAGHNDVHLRIK